MKSSLAQRCIAEALGTAFLLAAIVGSGIMAAKLAGGNSALALLCNTLSTGAMLTVLILALGPVSGAHFNPAVTLAFVWRREINWRTAALYVGSQILGAIAGVLAAHAMFDLPLWQVSQTIRSGGGQWFAEFIATLGLVLVIFCCLRGARQAIPYAVGLYITSAYWFTSSTSFASADRWNRRVACRCPRASTDIEAAAVNIEDRLP